MSSDHRDPPSGESASPRARPVETELDVDTVTVVRLVVIVLAFLAIIALLRQAPVMLTRILIGVVLALALDPIVVRIHRRTNWRRGTAVALVGTVLGAGFFTVLAILGPAAIDQASSLRADLPATVADAYSWPVVGSALEEREVADRVEEAINDLPAQLSDREITQFAEGLLGGVLTAVIVLVTAVTVMLDGEVFVNRFRRLFDGERGERIDRAGRIVYRTFGNYFAGSVFVAILNGFVILTVALALGIPLAPLAGLWATLTNLIPQIGGFLGGSFLVLLAFTEGPGTALIAAVAFLAYQNFENTVIQPTVVGKAVDLTPPTTMLAALVGGAVAGVPGALVATPVVGAIKVLYLRSQGVETDLDDAGGSATRHPLLRVIDRLRAR